ncbi:MAG: tripartite tricarboxylate transporter substrate-binding protein, partial [Candidatus Ventricola sp.]|nr:tripartite tricarboxylate transporter substrate-binding protein [Candidatus Ventricola sp.]
CKAHPGEVMMGGSSAGSVWHIAGGYLMNATGIEIKMITYANGAADAVKAAAQGEIQGVTVSLAEARSFIGNGLTVLGVMDSQRNPAFPDAATCQEQGFDIIYATQRGLAFPKGVDPEIRAKMEAACAAAIEDPDFVEFMANNGQTISYMTAEEYTEFLAQAAQDVPKAMEAVDLL